MKKAFDLHRFGLLMKWETLTEKKDYIRCTIGLAIALTFLFCIPILNMKMQGINSYPLGDREASFLFQLDQMSGMARFTIFMSLTIGASFIFNNMQTKQQRIAYLMMPATNLEKFLARYLHVSIGYMVCVAVALVFADLMQFIFTKIMLDGVGGSVIAKMYDDIFTSEDPSTFRFGDMRVFGCYVYAMVITIFVATNAFCTFCGTIYRRQAWLFTFCTAFVLWFLLIFINTNVYDFATLIFGNINEDNWKVYFWIILILMWVVNVALYWGSYKIFSRMQVINNKWLNIY